MLMIRFSIIMTILLLTVGIYGSSVSTSYAQNNLLGQNGNSNAEQTIEQLQASEQNSQCVSGEVTALSCNNVGLQAQSNSDEERPGGGVPPNVGGSPDTPVKPPGGNGGDGGDGGDGGCFFISCFSR
jgi:hypothetical protein